MYEKNSVLSYSLKVVDMKALVDSRYSPKNVWNEQTKVENGPKNLFKPALGAHSSQKLVQIHNIYDCYFLFYFIAMQLCK